MSADDVRDRAKECAGRVMGWQLLVRETPHHTPEWTDAALGAITDAALAAVAVAPGLAEALRGHLGRETTTRVTGTVRTPILLCECGTEIDISDEAEAAHLVDVVRAWLRGAT